MKVDQELMLKFFRVTVVKIAGWIKGVRIIFEVTQKSERDFGSCTWLQLAFDPAVTVSKGFSLTLKIFRMIQAV